MKTKLIGLFFLCLISSLSSYGVLAPTYTGNLEIKDRVARIDSPLTIRVFNLNESVEYRLEWTIRDNETFYRNNQNAYEEFQVVITELNENYTTIYLKIHSTNELIDSKSISVIQKNFFSIDDLVGNIISISSYIIIAGILGIVILLFLKKK